MPWRVYRVGGPKGKPVRATLITSAMSLALLVPLASNALAVQCEGVDTTSNCATTCAGTALSDFLFGGSPANVMNGLDDDDEVHGEGGGDRLCGGPDTDSVRGNGSDDDVYGAPCTANGRPIE